MKTLILFFALAVTPSAFAKTVVCSNSRLSYSSQSPDGGPQIAPSYSLTLDGVKLIDESPFRPGFNNARFALLGEPAVTNKYHSDENHVVTEFTSEATVTMSGDTQPVFDGQVTCKQVDYVGPPIP
jgi:hypothetical protein